MNLPQVESYQAHLSGLPAVIDQNFARFACHEHLLRHGQALNSAPNGDGLVELRVVPLHHSMWQLKSTLMTCYRGQIEKSKKHR